MEMRFQRTPQIILQFLLSLSNARIEVKTRRDEGGGDGKK